MAGQTATFVNRPKWGANYPPESVARSKRQGSINVVYIPDRISHCPTISGGTNHFAGQITRRRKADRLWAINPRKPSTSSRRRSRPKSTNQNSRSSRLCSRNNQAIKSSKACGSRQTRRETAEVMRFCSRAVNGSAPSYLRGRHRPLNPCRFLALRVSAIALATADAFVSFVV